LPPADGPLWAAGGCDAPTEVGLRLMCDTVASLDARPGPLSVVEQRYRAVLEVAAGVRVVEVA
jgi:hypothetical protein